MCGASSRIVPSGLVKRSSERDDAAEAVVPQQREPQLLAHAGVLVAEVRRARRCKLATFSQKQLESAPLEPSADELAAIDARDEAHEAGGVASTSQR